MPKKKLLNKAFLQQNYRLGSDPKLPIFVNMQQSSLKLSSRSQNQQALIP